MVSKPGQGIYQPRPEPCTALVQPAGQRAAPHSAACSQGSGPDGGGEMPPLCQVRLRTWDVGAKDSLSVWVHLAGLPACGRGTLPFVLTLAPAPGMTCFRACGYQGRLGWLVGLKCVPLVLGALRGTQGLFFPLWKVLAPAPTCSPSCSQKGGRTDFSHPGRHHCEQ